MAAEPIVRVRHCLGTCADYVLDAKAASLFSTNSAQHVSKTSTASTILGSIRLLCAQEMATANVAQWSFGKGLLDGKVSTPLVCSKLEQPLPTSPRVVGISVPTETGDDVVTQTASATKTPYCVEKL